MQRRPTVVAVYQQPPHKPDNTTDLPWSPLTSGHNIGPKNEYSAGLLWSLSTNDHCTKPMQEYSASPFWSPSTNNHTTGPKNKYSADPPSTNGHCTNPMHDYTNILPRSPSMNDQLPAPTTSTVPGCRGSHRPATTAPAHTGADDRREQARKNLGIDHLKEEDTSLHHLDTTQIDDVDMDHR